MMKWKWIVLVLIACICMLGWFVWAIQPVSGKKLEKISIDQGTSVSEIAQNLYQHNLIRNPFAFKIYLYGTHHAKGLKAGDYQFQQGQPIQDMLRIMENGDQTFGTVRFTIPEGYTVEDIANRLQQEGIVSASSFIQEADHGTFHESFVEAIPKNTAMKHRLEGYLFPDTYEIYKGSSAHDIIDTMLKTFDHQFTPDMVSEAKSEHLSIHQVVTIASMIEKEAKVSKERPIIAGVINNRLHQHPPMPLQLDATVQYIVGFQTALTSKDLKVQNPYNTYTNLGLPPGPIGSPGLPSIQAVLHSDKNTYLYYVVKNDGSGEHFFASTFAEQLQNEAKSQRNVKNASH